MATTNNIGLYCFDTGNEDAKTSLEALFGAGNSNMKKIDDAIGELKKKSFIVNTEADLNALLTEENLGKTVSYNGALYVIAEGGGTENPTAVGDTVTQIYFDSSKSTEETYADLQELDWNNPDFINNDADAGEMRIIGFFAENEEITSVAEKGVVAVYVQSMDLYQIVTNGGETPLFMYSPTMSASDMGLEAWGWIPFGDYTSPITLNNPFVIGYVRDKNIWGSWLSATNEFAGSSGGGIIAKPVGAEGGGGLPSFAPEDAGKFLRVDSNGNIVAEAIAYAEGESF